mmetsp:Transcript_19116/g.28626  ORF Transcript_19116/g.28626 Transcript_19116/m.28626 type:complete len:91 (-) Transcript_19116:619-891(-)
MSENQAWAGGGKKGGGDYYGRSTSAASIFGLENRIFTAEGGRAEIDDVIQISNEVTPPCTAEYVERQGHHGGQEGTDDGNGYEYGHGQRR